MCDSRAQFGQSGDVSSHDAYNGASSDANSVNFSMVEALEAGRDRSEVESRVAHRT